MNRARIVVLQVMSARSQSNSLYECGGLEYVTMRADGRRQGAHAAWDEVVMGPEAIHRLPLPWRVRRKLGNWAARPRAKALVAEAREAWLRSSLTLLERIEPPVLLLWFSKRPPAERQRYGSGTILGEFPHLVTPGMLEALGSRVAAIVECTTSRGSPQPLVSRFTGGSVTVTPADDREDLGRVVWSENRYYPSPGMHEDAAHALLAVLRERPELLG